MQDRKKILMMVAEGKISAREGNDLLFKLKKMRSPDHNESNKKLNIKLSSETEEYPILKATIPLNLVKAGFKIFPSGKNIMLNLSDKQINLSSIDWNEVFRQASNSETGDVFNLEYLDHNNERLRLHVYIDSE
jgi:hypothetical protein